MSASWPASIRRTTCLAGLGLAAVVASGCGSDNGTTNTSNNTDAGCVSGALAGGGSTFQLNLEQQWAADFTAQCPDAQINYAGVGSGAGIQQFAEGTIDFAGSDVPMLPDEQSAADERCDGKAVTFPVTAGGVAVIYNLEGVSDLRLSATTLAGMFQGTVKRWDDAAIKADNPDATLPSTPVVSYHRADGSGTTAVFSAFETAAAGKVWKLGSGKELTWPAGQGATGSDGVVQGVKSTNGGITYAEVSFATATSLPTAAIGTRSGDFVELTADTVSDAIDTGFEAEGAGSDVVGTIDVAGLSGYPLSTVSYAIVCEQYADSDTAARVKAYLGYALDEGQSAAPDLGFAPLPSGLADSARTALENVG